VKKKGTEGRQARQGDGRAPSAGYPQGYLGNCPAGKSENLTPAWGAQRRGWKRPGPEFQNLTKDETPKVEDGPADDHDAEGKEKIKGMRRQDGKKKGKKSKNHN